MLITVATESGGVFPLEVSGDLTLEDLKGLLEIETGVKITQMLLIHNMAPMTDDHKSLRDYGVQADDIIMVTEFTGPVTTSNPSPLYQPSTSGAGATVGIPPSSAHSTGQVQPPACINPLRSHATLTPCVPRLRGTLTLYTHKPL